MKFVSRIALGALAFALMGAPAAQAQQNVFVMNRGMLGIRHEPVPANSPTSRMRVVLEVVKGSPAEKAGLVKGDTIISINGLAASAAVMNAPFEPGDAVSLRVKRNGKQHDVRIVAAESSNRVFATVRAQGRAGTLLSDTVMGNISIIMDRIQTNMDAAGRRGTVRIQKFNGDSIITYQYGDSIFRSGNVFRAFPHDSMGLFFSRDSLMTSRFRMISPDSMHRFYFREGFPTGDSIFTRFLSRDMPGAVFGFGGDSLRMIRPAEIFESGFTMGMRAVAGAELQEMNPGLAEYFGTASGVLVTNARAGTPAEKAGLRSGDVILSVNRTSVRTIPELRRAIDSASGRTVAVRVLRRGQNVDVTLNKD